MVKYIIFLDDVGATLAPWLLEDTHLVEDRDRCSSFFISRLPYLATIQLSSAPSDSTQIFFGRAKKRKIINSFPSVDVLLGC